MIIFHKRTSDSKLNVPFCPIAKVLRAIGTNKSSSNIGSWLDKYPLWKVPKDYGFKTVMKGDVLKSLQAVSKLVSLSVIYWWRVFINILFNSLKPDGVTVSYEISKWWNPLCNMSVPAF